VYEQSFSCKINCTEVIYTATKLHKSPDEADRARSRSIFQMRLQLWAKTQTPVDDTTPPAFTVLVFLPACYVKQILFSVASVSVCCLPTHTKRKTADQKLM